MLRITSGSLKNRILSLSKSSSIRPTTDKVRAALFSSLGEDVHGCCFLDVFSGTGAVGIEAFSRGAESVTFVETNTESLVPNLRLLPDKSFSLYCKDFLKVKLNGQFDIIFLDPPYGKFTPLSLLQKIADDNLLLNTGTIIIEESCKVGIPETAGFIIIKERVYGDSKLTFLQHRGSDEDNLSGDI